MAATQDKASDNIFRKAVLEALANLKEISGMQENDINNILEVPSDKKLGDYAFPCFSFAKKFKKSPNAVAEELAKKIKPDSLHLIEIIESTGPYLNFFINPQKIAQETLKKIEKEKNDYGRGDRKVLGMIEFSSPNTNKPLHLGHLRNICLGESVSRISEFQGEKIIRACLVNDRGIHICKSMLMYEKYGNSGEPEKTGKKSDHFVGDFYVMFNNEAKENPDVEKEAQEMLIKWEAGDKNVISLWKKMNLWANNGFSETYREIGVKFDKYYYESDIYKDGKEIIVDGLKRGIFSDEDGAVVAELEKYKLPKKVLIRSDGTTIYMTQDIFLAKKKFEDYKLDKSVYVVATEQNLHFQQLFKILEMLGFSFAEKCRHLSYGMVNLPSGKMKSREGTVVDADDIMNELEKLAMEEIKKRYEELNLKEKEDRAKKISLSALKFYLLKMDPAKDMVFNPEESISFDGETGPYVQYSYARASSILRKYEKNVSSAVDFSVYNDSETAIIKHLFFYPETAADAANCSRPSLVCRYLLDLCQMFNEYYHSTPVLKAKEDSMKARLLLVSCVREVIRSGLSLLGIDALEEM